MSIPIRYNLRSLRTRPATTIATAVGIALVVFVLGASMMLSAGVKRTLSAAGSPKVAIVLRAGSDNELGSTIEDAQVAIIRAQPGLRKGAAGKPVSAAEVVVVTAMEKIGAAGVTNMLVRGVEEDVLQFRPNVKVVAGRMPKPGTDEAMVGARIRGRFRGVDLGQSFPLKKNRQVTIVGVFEDGGSSYESEVWVDLDTLRATFGREGIRSAVRVELDDENGFDAFKRSFDADKRLGLVALRETTYFEKQSEGTGIFISVLGTLVSVFFSVGAIVGAAITMGAAVAHRQREIGVLRALGFSRAAVMISFVMEALFLSAAGGLVGLLGALALSSVKFSMMNFSSWSELVFSFDATPGVIITCIVFALLMGLLGGFFPALRASRTSPAVAMRA